MALPRQVLAGQFYMVTRRCAQRQYLLRPDPATYSAFIYCLTEAAQRFGIVVLMVLAESNHYHAVIFDPHGLVPAFLQRFHSLFARCQNALRGRWENLWSAGEPCVTNLVDAQTVIDKMVYVASNPVKDHLVKHAHQWPGVSGLGALKRNQPLRAVRPRHFFRDCGPMPERVELPMTIPAELGDRDKVVARVLAGVAAVEADAAAELAKSGGRVLGVRNIFRQSWKDAPTSREPRRGLRPRFAGLRDARIAALVAYREFLFAYKEARARLLARRSSAFPLGTYWLKRFVAVPIALHAN